MPQDRFPIICAAGKVIPEGGLTNELKDYSLDEIAENIVKQKKLEEKCQRIIDSGVVSKIPPKPNSDTVQTLIEASLNKFRFKEFEENFFEDLYYQTAKAGRVGQCARIGSKPDHITNTSRTFGKAIKYDGPCYDIVFPRKTAEQVLREQQVFHDKYILSHNSYFPSEKVKRYPKEIFDPTGKTFGIWNNVDISGKKVKNALTDSSIGQIIIINTIHEDIIKKRNFQLGKAIKRQDLNNPEGLSYGSDARKDKYNASCLIHNLPPCPALSELNEAVSYVCNLRIKLKNKVGFNLTAVEITLRGIDKKNTLHADWSVVFQVLAEYFLHVDQYKIKLLATHLKLVNEAGHVNYIELLKLLELGKQPDLGNLVNMPPTNKDECTTYKAFSTDFKRYPICEYIRPAGALGNEKAQKPKMGCRGDLESLCDETDVGTCLSPSISCQFGLSHRDYLLPRSKEEIRRIFKKLLNNIDDEQFDKLYDEALHLHTSLGDKASVEAFKCCLVKYRKIQAIKVISL